MFMGLGPGAPVTRQRAGRLWVLAVVAVLHAGGLWGLLKATLPLKIRTSTSLELTYLTLDRRESTARKPAPVPHSQRRGRQSVGILPLAQPPPPSKSIAAATAEENDAIHPPIDWASELARTSREVASSAAAPQPRAFGAPHLAPAPPPKPLEFGWSRPRTRRLEAGANGTAVRLGDNCVIAFTPLPFPMCRLGKEEANGDLFKHMRDPPQFGDWKSPP